VSDLLRSYLTAGIFLAVSVALVASIMGLGSLIRPTRPQPEKYVNYESGRIISSGATQTELEVGFFSLITTAVTAQFRYQLRSGAASTNRYRLQIDTSW